ncbi:MAG: hypothetical protein WAW91_03660 [Candidatus Nanoperiomorbaceae bacterium]
MKPIAILSKLIDRVTMYQLLLYYLVAILLLAAFLGSIGVIAYSPFAILGSAAVTVIVAYVTNCIFAWAYEAPSNPLSAVLTALILALIITPSQSIDGLSFIIIASGVAVASKYILAIKHQHIFNPAAIAVVLTSFLAGDSASWWVGSTALAPLVIIGGIVLVKKVRKLRMVGLFILLALVSTFVFASLAGKNGLITIQTAIAHSSLFFLAFAMLTEPLTSPSIWRQQILYVLIVGLLFSPSFNIFGFYFTPELALALGNIFAFWAGHKAKTMIRLTARNVYGKHTEDVTFTPAQPLAYKPGQYVDITMPHAHADSRGIRRTFTLASSPTEKDLRFGIRYYEPSSSFKTAFRLAPVNLFASVGNVGGEFTLPNDKSRKIAFIAGGIGVTPYRSMIKYLSDTNDRRDVVLLYGERNRDDITYANVFETARSKIDTRTNYIIGATIDGDCIQKYIPDFNDRLFYLSGPQTMVAGIKKTLLRLGVRRHNIKTDYFSGYA